MGAHPDDIEFGAGATLARWAEDGCEVSLLVCTDGSKGTWDADADIAALVATRRDEARAAARQLGATGEVVLLDQVDGELAHDRATTSEIARWIRVLRPDVLLGHDPWKRYRLHPDHRAAGFLVTDALVAARDPHFFREHGVAHHRPDALLLFEADEPDHAEPAGGAPPRRQAGRARGAPLAVRVDHVHHRRPRAGGRRAPAVRPPASGARGGQGRGRDGARRALPLPPHRPLIAPPAQVAAAIGGGYQDTALDVCVLAVIPPPYHRCHVR
ncbi:MAG: PIG-L deacetylase family protein [Acidimicrobiales bacterium]